MKAQYVTIALLVMSLMAALFGSSQGAHTLLIMACIAYASVEIKEHIDEKFKK